MSGGDNAVGLAVGGRYSIVHCNADRQGSGDVKQKKNGDESNLIVVVKLRLTMSGAGDMQMLKVQGGRTREQGAKGRERKRGRKKERKGEAKLR